MVVGQSAFADFGKASRLGPSPGPVPAAWSQPRQVLHKECGQLLGVGGGAARAGVGAAISAGGLVAAGPPCACRPGVRCGCASQPGPGKPSCGNPPPQQPEWSDVPRDGQREDGGSLVSADPTPRVPSPAVRGSQRPGSCVSSQAPAGRVGLGGKAVQVAAACVLPTDASARPRTAGDRAPHQRPPSPLYKVR